MNRGTWWATVHGVAKSQTQLRARTHTPLQIHTQRTLSASENSIGFMHNHLKIALEAPLVQREHLKHRQKQILKITVNYCSYISLTLVP